jgi:hypothetical protein
MTMLIASAAFLMIGIAAMLGVAKTVYRTESVRRNQPETEAIDHAHAA